MTCPKCGSEMSTEDKIIAALFGNNLCAYCQERGEKIKYPDILVNSRPLSDYINEIAYWDDPWPYPDKNLTKLLEGEQDDYGN